MKKTKNRIKNQCGGILHKTLCLNNLHSGKAVGRGEQSLTACSTLGSPCRFQAAALYDWSTITDGAFGHRLITIILSSCEQQNDHITDRSARELMNSQPAESNFMCSN